MVDLLALASRSTSHRPSCPKAWRAMPRCRPGLRLPGPLPSRCSHAAPDRSEAPLRRREDRCSAEPVGVARRWHRPDHHVPPPGEPGGLPRWLGADSPCTDAADDDLAEAWARTVFRRPPPEGDLFQTRLPGPGRRCALRYGAHIAGRITPGQGLFLNSQGSPQNFFVTHRKRWFIHRSCTVISTLPGAHRIQWVSRSARPARHRSALDARTRTGPRQRPMWVQLVSPPCVTTTSPAWRRCRITSLTGVHARSPVLAVDDLGDVARADRLLRTAMAEQGVDRRARTSCHATVGAGVPPPGTALAEGDLRRLDARPCALVAGLDRPPRRHQLGPQLGRRACPGCAGPRGPSDDRSRPASAPPPTRPPATPG